MIFTTGLLIYHTSLIWRNLTTKEELKNSFRNIYSNPYRRGLCKNIRKILCPKLNNPDIAEKIRNKIANKKINLELAEKEKEKLEKLEKKEKKEIIKSEEKSEKENEEKINSEKISGKNRTKSDEKIDYQKKRVKIYIDNDIVSKTDEDERKNKSSPDENQNIKNPNFVDMEISKKESILQDEKIEEKGIYEEKDSYLDGFDSNNELNPSESNIENKENNIEQQPEEKKIDSIYNKELCNSQIKVFFPQGKKDEKSVDFNLEQSMEVNQEGIVSSNLHESN